MINSVQCTFPPTYMSTSDALHSLVNRKCGVAKVDLFEFNYHTTTQVVHLHVCMCIDLISRHLLQLVSLTSGLDENPQRWILIAMFIFNIGCVYLLQKCTIQN
uniref:Uncharacterized protein n=1 Tax=Arundo donax TaxID=35708 RepID=A0A0A8XUA7_ARUDO